MRRLAMLAMIATAIFALFIDAPQVSAQDTAQDSAAIKYLVVFTSDAWQSNPRESALVSMVTSPPQGSPLESWVQGATVKHYTPADPTYRERFGTLAPPDKLPAVIVQRGDGGYVYKATADNVPTDHYTLGREIEYFAGLDPLRLNKNAQGYAMADSSSVYGSIEWSGQLACPDGRCPMPMPSPPQSRPLVQVGPDSVDLQPSFDFGQVGTVAWVAIAVAFILALAMAALMLVAAAYLIYRLIRR